MAANGKHPAGFMRGARIEYRAEKCERFSDNAMPGNNNLRSGTLIPD
jgi:hypothetical protein